MYVMGIGHNKLVSIMCMAFIIKSEWYVGIMLHAYSSEQTVSL